jgi:hypothetical protein
LKGSLLDNKKKMNNSNIKTGITVKTPDGRAIVKVIDSVGCSVRVEHIEARTPVTDYRFSDLEILCSVCKDEKAVVDGKCTTCHFEIGDKANLLRNPLDEQLGEFIVLGEKIIIDVKDVSHIAGTSGQWVKIKEHNDWICSSYFKKL